MRKISSLTLRTFIKNVPCAVKMEMWEDLGKAYAEITYEFVVNIPEQFLYQNLGKVNEVESIDADRISALELQAEYLREDKSPFKRVEIITHKRAPTCNSMQFYRKHDKSAVRAALNARKRTAYGKIRVRVMAKSNFPHQRHIAALEIFLNKVKSASEWKSQ